MLKVADRDSHRGRHLAGGLTLQASYYSRGFPYTVFSWSFISSKPVLSGTYTRRHGTRRPLLRVASLRWGGIAEPHCLQQEISRDVVGDNTEQHGDGDHRHHRIVAGQLGIEDTMMANTMLASPRGPNQPTNSFSVILIPVPAKQRYTGTIRMTVRLSIA